MAGFVFFRCEEPRCELHNVEIKREAVRLVRSGMSDYQVADILGVHHGTVGKWARGAGIVRGKGGGCVAKENAERNIEARSRMAEAASRAGDGEDSQPQGSGLNLLPTTVKARPRA